MRELKGRVAVVTGAASGIGRATSVLLAKNGCELALADVNQEGMKDTADLVQAQGAKVSMHVVDVADKEAMQRLPEAVIAEHGHVHIVINNAGVSVSGTLEEQSLEDLEWIIGINLWGVIYGCKFFIPYLKREEEGHIVNLSSVFGLIGLPSQSSYNLTKFAVRGLSESLYAELAGDRIGVTSVHPGGIQTEIIQASRVSEESERQGLQELFDRIALPPERVAEKIVGAIRTNAVRVRVCRETYAIDWLKRLFPSGTQRLAAWANQRGGFRAERFTK